MNDDYIENHESFAQISASRVSSGVPVTMYGSKLKHGRYIMLSITTSELRRGATEDRYMDRNEIIRVRMSENQFATFITSLNIGGGTPCTIERLQGKGIPSPPYRNEMAVVKSEFETLAKTVAKTLADAEKRLAAMVAPGGKASKAELNALQQELAKATREIGQNMPYMAECFEETLEDVMTSAKTDIEAYMADMSKRAGMTGLAAPVTLTIEQGEDNVE